MQQPTIAIIGAGASGLGVAKALGEVGLAFEIIEATLVEEADRDAASPCRHHLAPNVVVEKSSPSNLVANRTLEVQTLLALFVGEFTPTLFDDLQHGHGGRACLPQPNSCLMRS